MKKSFFFATMLLSIATTAQQRTFVKSVGTNYAAKQVTFNISWAAGSRGTVGTNTYNSKVWVLVDYQEVQNGVAVGNWKRANVVLSSLPAGCTADGTNTKGFWYQGQATVAQNANITVTLSGVPAQFNWCAFASDCPPQAIFSNGSYTLKGSPPFTLTTGSGTTVTNSRSYTGCITAITDVTSCPGNAQPCCRGVNANVGDDGCCTAGLTLVGGYCRNLTADGAKACTACGWEYKMASQNTNTENMGCPAGWRPAANSAELICLYQQCEKNIALIVTSETRTGTCHVQNISCYYAYTNAMVVWSPFDAGGCSWTRIAADRYELLNCFHGNNYAAYRAMCLR